MFGKEPSAAGAAAAHGLAPALTYCLGGFQGLYTPFMDLSSKSETMRPAKLKYLLCGRFREVHGPLSSLEVYSTAFLKFSGFAQRHLPRCPPPTDRLRARPAASVAFQQAGRPRRPAQNLRWLLTWPGEHPGHCRAGAASLAPLSPRAPPPGLAPPPGTASPRALHFLLPRGTLLHRETCPEHPK